MRLSQLPFLSVPRRSLLQFAGFALSAPAWSLAAIADQPAPGSATGTPGKSRLGECFPTQAPELAREMVRVAHFDLKRVQELVEAQPSLARAAWDWGFGDWESALGAASHMGNRPIAEYLISKGARPSLFSAAMLGQLEVVKAFVSAQPGAQRIRGPHSISLLAHAHAGGEAARSVFEYLQTLGDAGAEAAAPLAQQEMEAIVGVYRFGEGANDVVDVTADKNGVMWTRRGTMGRPLFHLGGRVFYPLGASSVRIRFTAQKDGTRMTVQDPDVVMAAVRSK